MSSNEYGDLSTAKEKNTNEMTKEEKLRLRQLRMAQWKAKKSHSPDTASKIAVTDSEATIKPNKLNKIEEWKRRKANVEPKSLNNNIEAKSGIILKPNLIKKTGVKKVTKRSIFQQDEEEDEESTPKKKKLRFGDNGVPVLPTTEENEPEYSLDDYIKDLEMKEIANNKNSLLSVDTKFIDDEIDYNDLDENEHQTIDEIISDKIEKLQNKGKNLEQIDHKNMNYEPFKKIFYSEPSELSKWSKEDVDTTRLLLDGIRVRGIDCPKPILKWSHLGLPQALQDVLTDLLKYEEPSSIQSQTLPAIMSGRDVIGIAKTGSGKTLSFVLPLIRHIIGQEYSKIGHGPRGIVVAPTRELSLQIFKEVSHFTRKLDIRACCCYGGTSIQSQIADLKRGVDIIVGTPGRIIDLLAVNGGRVTDLNSTTMVILDEADRMFDMGFEPQVNKIFSQVRPDRQTVLFSATFPKKMELLAKKVLDNPIEIMVGGRNIVAPEITQIVKLVDKDKKIEQLFEILEGSNFDSSKTLIFVERQSDADNLLVQIMRNGYKCSVIHGGKDQLDRKHSVKQFTSGEIQILIATSIASRGLDVKDLNLVINYDAPSHMEDYVHRVGRTGRAGMKGTAVTFVSSDQERSITDLVKALKLSNVPDSEISPELIKISQSFLEKVKAGTIKYSFGFGGKGLEKLQEVRDTKQDIERKSFGETARDGTNMNMNKLKTLNDKKDEVNKSQEKIEFQFPDWKIIEGGAPETAGPDQGKFHARISVNDLPQKARMLLVSRETISKIIESTNTSITNKGQYYAPGVTPQATFKNGKKIEPPAKLYLLVEGQDVNSLESAIWLMKQKMVDSLQMAEQEEGRSGSKYTV